MHVYNPTSLQVQYCSFEGAHGLCKLTLRTLTHRQSALTIRINNDLLINHPGSNNNGNSLMLCRRMIDSTYKQTKQINRQQHHQLSYIGK